jgi:hypothetical protein
MESIEKTGLNALRRSVESVKLLKLYVKFEVFTAVTMKNLRNVGVH